MQRCAKPGCGRHGAVVLAYDYDTRRAVLTLPGRGELSPHLYALCLVCADKLRPPLGWELVDERPAPDDELTKEGAGARREEALAGAGDVLFAP